MNTALQKEIETLKNNIEINCSLIKQGVETISLSNNEEYLDIFFLMDIISAANNLNVFKYSLSNFKNNSFKTFENFNVKIQKNIDSNINFNYFYLEADLKTKNPVCLNLLNPCNAKDCFIGTDDFKSSEKIANLMINLNYLNAIVVSSKDNLPFMTLNEENYIAEAWKNKVFSYTLTSDLFNIKNVENNKLKVENKEHNKEIIENILNNKIKDHYFDFTVLNSGLVLYISKKADSLIKGVELAKNTIKSNKAKEKFTQILSHYKK